LGEGGDAEADSSTGVVGSEWLDSSPESDVAKATLRLQSFIDRPLPRYVRMYLALSGYRLRRKALVGYCVIVLSAESNGVSLEPEEGFKLEASEEGVSGAFGDLVSSAGAAPGTVRVRDGGRERVFVFDVEVESKSAIAILFFLLLSVVF
jgi:hypothetical protein